MAWLMWLAEPSTVDLNASQIKIGTGVMEEEIRLRILTDTQRGAGVIPGTDGFSLPGF
jgi:hypothetical protein